MGRLEVDGFKAGTNHLRGGVRVGSHLGCGENKWVEWEMG